MKTHLLLLLATAMVARGEIVQDFDHDDRDERIVFRDGTALIESQGDRAGEWISADFQLPPAIASLPLDGSLRFLDLNDDGCDDLLRSDEDGYYIALWSTEVKPQLGWEKGWSQFVRQGQRRSGASEPPALAGAELRIADGDLVVARPGEPDLRISLRALIAFDMPPPRSPADALASFQVRDGFAIELVAAEPEVIDPVAFEWGADGRLWVVEMRDYPLGVDGQGKVGGVVKFLEDQDGDGRYEKSTVFLDGLAYPSGVMPWRDGVLISAAPEILFAADGDGDGRADRREVVLTGFNPGNQQHRVNGFEWGLDGWIYLANGDSGGKVRSIKTNEEVEISGRDLRFRPDSGEIETVSSQSQFGRRRDDFGNWFGNNNPTWLWQVRLPERYLRRNPELAVRSPKHLLANYEEATRVFPTSVAPERPNQPWSLNHVTSACSPCPYRAELFGEAFASSVFISEPVHNVVHREVLIPDGAGFRSRRAAGEELSEFLSSSDSWFRPTTLKTGPDGALYIADFYRFVIEHPEWISPEMQARLDLRAGEDRGRIYRVIPAGSRLREIPGLGTLDAVALARAIDSPNGWQRDTVQRLLFETGITEEAAAMLEEALSPTRAPQVRAQALATLGQSHRLTAQRVIRALADPHPGVRIQALRQAESLADTPDGASPLLTAVAAAADDSSPAVRLQAAFSLGAFPPPSSEPALAKLIARDGQDEWIRAAVMSSLIPGSEMFAALDRHTKLAPASVDATLVASSSDRAKVIARYAAVATLDPDAGRGHQHFLTLCASCHRLGGDGVSLGPDLDMVRGKPTDWLLAAILDPGAAVEARFAAWTVTLASGDSLVGIITAETSNSLTLRLPGGQDFPVLRGEIATLNPAGTTLMPAGFEGALDPQAMADLIAWIRREG